nr:hypothetical protein [Tanacetum cinerariifolium]
MASIKKANDVVKLQALIDGKKVVVTKDVIRQDLCLDDADGVVENLAVICLATGRKFNFSKYIFDSMVRNMDSPSKFLMRMHPNRGRIAEIDADEDVTLVDMETQGDMNAELQGRINDDNAATKDVNTAPTVFDDEEVTMTMAQTLIKMKAEKAKLLDEHMDKRFHDEEVEQAVAREKQEKMIWRELKCYKSSVNPFIDHHCCYECGNSLNGFFCHQCTCEFCGNGAHVGYNCPAQSSIEKLVPNPSESEGESECAMPASEAFTTFLNVLFDVDYDFYSVDDQSLFDEDLPEKIYSNPLFDEEIIPMKIDHHSFNAESDLIESMLNHDSSIINSSKIDSLFDEFAGELTFLKSIPPGIDETDCDHEKEINLVERLLYDNSSPRPPKEFVYDNSDAKIESFSPSPIPDDDHDSERDIPILEEFLNNSSLSLPDKELYHFDIPSPSRPPAKPPDGNTRILNIKMMGDIFDQKVPIPNLMITRVSSLEKSPDLLPHQGLEIFQPFAEWPMIINGKNTPLLNVPLFHFYPP